LRSALAATAADRSPWWCGPGWAEAAVGAAVAAEAAGWRGDFIPPFILKALCHFKDTIS